MSMEFNYTDAVTGEIVQIPVGMLYHHPDNPRKELGDLTELADSIRAKGVLQNLTVVPGPVPDGATRWKYGYTVVIGNRRMEAAKLAGLETVPCVIAQMTPAEQVQTMLLENMQRSDLTVFEQAQGFQMMMDFGETVDTVAEKTGFSKTTVRRRLELAKLDPEKLKEASGRQVPLADLDKLTQIDDIGQRNALLDCAGTYNFNSRLNWVLRRQNTAKVLPAAKAQIKAMHAAKIDHSATYGGKYARLGGYIYLYDWDGVTPFDVPAREKLFYYLDEEGGELAFFEKKEREVVKRTPEEIEAEKKANFAAETLRQATAEAYNRRRDFVGALAVRKKDEQKLIKWLCRTILFEHVHWLPHVTKDVVARAIGVDDEEYRRDPVRLETYYDAVERDAHRAAVLLWIYLGDDAGTDYVYYNTYEQSYGKFPTHEPNARLDLIYDFLCDFGYQPEEFEKKLRDGTSPWFRPKPKDPDFEDAEDEDDGVGIGQSFSDDEDEDEEE